MTAMDLEGDDDAAPAPAHPKWLRHIAETNEITQPYKPESGALLKLGQFEIAKEIGRGGYGRVYLARDNQLQRDVAIKVIDEKFYMREQYAARIPHKNIVQFYESFSEQGSRCLVLEYVPGQSLARWFSPNRVPPLEKAVSIAADVAMALVAMHEAGVAHRDLTSSNVILTRDHQVKVIDFGIAVFEATHRLEDLETPGANKATRSGICGTPGFAAPEQMGIGEAVSVDLRKGDLWSLGVVLFLLVTGRLPFKEIHVDTYTDALRTHAKAGQAAPRLGELVPEVPSALDRLVARLLSFDPHARGTAESATFTLQEILKGLQYPEYETSLTYEGNPFRALCAFGPGDAEIFHERGKDTKALLALVNKNRLALLQGDSGVGKSSLIQAGLRPRIWQQLLWLEVAPGRDPDRSPLETVRKAAAQALEQRQQASEERTLDGMLATLVMHTRKPVLLVLDQFEEIFQRADRATMEHDARVFGDALASVVNRPGIDLRVLIVIRTDHYHYLDLIKEVLPISTDDGEILRRLEPRSTKRSMSHLFERIGLDVAHTVLDDVIAAVSTQNEVNAVELQLVLHHLYEYASTLENTSIDRLSLTAMGGPKGVLDQHLEAVESRLSENSIPVVRPVMASLIGEGGVRKPGLTIPLIAQASGIEEDVVRKVVDALRNERILTVDGTSGNRALSFQVACDRLARTVWLKVEEKEFISQREFLLDCMREAPAGRWRGGWWFGGQNVEKRERMLRGFGAHTSRATPVQHDFVAKVREWDHDLDKKNLVSFLGVILLLVVVGTIVVIAFVNHNEYKKDQSNAERSRQRELQEQEASYHGKLRAKEALRLETEAELLLPTDAGKALVRIAQAADLRGGFDKEEAAYFNKHFLLAMKAWHNGVGWIATSHMEEVRAAAIVSQKNGGKILVSIGGDNVVGVIDLELGGTSAIHLQIDGKHKVLETSPDGNWAAIGDDDGKVHVLDLQSNEVKPLESRCMAQMKCEIKRLAFSPDGRFLAAGGTNESGVHIWALHDNPSRWEDHGPVKGHDHRVRTLMFSPHEWHLLLSSDVNGVAKLTNVDSFKQIWRHEANGDHSSATFSQDGERIALVQDNAVETYHLNGHGTWEQEGDIVVPGTREIRMVDLHNGAPSKTPSADMMALGTKEGVVHFYAWNDDRRQWTSNGDWPSFSVGNSGVRTLRFESQNDRLWLLASSIDGKIHWRDINGPMERVFNGKTGWGAAPILSPDLDFIVADGGNGLLKLWFINDGDVSGKASRRNSDKRDGKVHAKPCVRYGLTANATGRIIELGTTTGPDTATLEETADYVDDLLFSGNCRILTSKSRDGIVRQWPLPPAARNEFAKWLDKRAPYTVNGDRTTAKPLPPLSELSPEKP